MQKEKPNWSEIKQAYFDNGIDEVRAFLRSRYGELAVAERTIDNRTKGWAEERKRFKAKLTAKAEEKIINNPKVQDRIERLISSLELIENSISYIVTAKRKKIIMPNGEERLVLDRELNDMKDIKIAYDILRLGTGKSTENHGGDKDNPIAVENKISTLSIQIVSPKPTSSS
jgi:hypothetical protein